MSRVLIVRLGSLGDLIHTLPAAAAIRRAMPDAEIDWLVDAPHRELLTLVPVISSIVTLGGRSVGDWLTARRTLRERRYDVALDFQGLIKSALLARLSGAKRIVGFDRASAREGSAAMFYSECVAAEGGHVIEKNLRLAAAIGVRAEATEFPLRPVLSPALDAVRAEVREPFALLNPGAAWPNKRWPTESFAAISRHLRDHHGLRSVVLWGPAEQPLASGVAAASGGAAVVAPATRLADLVALSREARFMLSGDTGPTHIAAAVGTPIVALFGPTSPARNGPWNRDDVVLSRYDQCDCHYQRTCRRSSGWCLGTISVDEVRAAVDRRLAVQPQQRRAPVTP
jgi:lipopolysaccharide heptosyltransferase I